MSPVGRCAQDSHAHSKAKPPGCENRRLCFRPPRPLPFPHSLMRHSAGLSNREWRGCSPCPLLPFRGCGHAQSDRQTVARLRAHACSFGATLVTKTTSSARACGKLGQLGTSQQFDEGAQFGGKFGGNWVAFSQALANPFPDKPPPVTCRVPTLAPHAKINRRDPKSVPRHSS